MILEKKDDDILIQTLHGLIKSWETEIIEFKEAKGNFDDDRL